MSLCATCGGRKTGRRCDHCAGATTKPETRPNASARLYGHKWRVASEVFLSRPENRICRICNRRLAECVDHIRDHHGDLTAFWDAANWQPACISCNTRKANGERRRGRRRSPEAK